jgi:hypothetical protein
MSDVLEIKHRLAWLKPNTVYRLQKLIFLSDSFPGADLIPPEKRKLDHPANSDCEYFNLLRYKVNKYFENSQQTCLTSADSDLLFISRRKGAIRQFRNQVKIESEFAKAGFDVHYFEDYTPADQLSLVRNASCIAGFHGAGLTNIVASQPKARIFELISTRASESYFRAANLLNNCYLCLDNRNSANPQHLDLHKLRNYISLVSSPIDNQTLRPWLSLYSISSFSPPLGHRPSAQLKATLNRLGAMKLSRPVDSKHMSGKYDTRLPKVFVIGHNKCATRSIDRIFKESGYRSIHWDKGALAERMRANLFIGLPLLHDFEDYHCYSDMEVAAEFYGNTLFPLLDLQYPNSLFIYNRRPVDAWIRSRLSHGGYAHHCLRVLNMHDPNAFSTISDVEDHWKECYKRHERSIDHYFDGKSNLVRLEIDDVDSWLYLKRILSGKGFLINDIDSVPVVGRTA